VQRRPKAAASGHAPASMTDFFEKGLIASAQKLEHYEIAAYGTVAALAGQLDLRDDQQTLHESLEEEKQADLRLTKLAKREVNPDALAA
jgi:ferritin-like metal-binding protein YciE